MPPTPEDNDQAVTDATRLGFLADAVHDEALPQVVRDVAAAAAERIADRYCDDE
jgi:hypothetical protein